MIRTIPLAHMAPAYFWGMPVTTRPRNVTSINQWFMMWRVVNRRILSA